MNKHVIRLPLVLLLGSCAVDLEVPQQATVTCASDTECPVGLLCDPVAQRCRKPGFSLPNLGPSVTLTLQLPSEGRPLDHVLFDVRLADPNNDAVDLSVEYALAVEGPWHPATVVESLNALAAPAGSALHTFTWDLTAPQSGLNHVTATLADNSTATVLGFTNRLWMRLRASDRSSTPAASDYVVSAPFAAGNDAPIATLAPGEPPLSGATLLAVALTDTSHDSAGIEITYRTSPTEPWHEAAITLGLTEQLATGATTPLEHVVVWDSRLPPDVMGPGGVGAVNVEALSLRVRAWDTPSAGVRHFGAWSEITNQRVQNQTPPRLEEFAVLTHRAEAQGGAVVLSFRAVDDEEDPADLQMHYSIDGGVSWRPCTELPMPMSEGRYGLATAAATAGERSGVSHLFYWDATSDLHGLEAEARVRARLADKVAGPGAPTFLTLARPVGRSATLLDPAHYSGIDLDTDSLGYSFVARLNDDGIDDFIVTGYNALLAYTGNGTGDVWDGTFSGAQATNFGPTYERPHAGDINGDGYTDVFWLTGQFTPTVVVALAEVDVAGPTGRLVAGPTQALTDMTAFLNDVADIDGDGELDIAFVDDDNLHVLLGNGDATFSSHPVVYPRHNAFAFALVDINGDGRADLVYDVPHQYGDADDNEIGVSLARAAASPQDVLFAEPFFIQAPAGAVDYLPRGDLDGDGITDVLFAAVADDGTTVGLLVLRGGQGAQTAAEFRVETILDIQKLPLANASIGDVDGDGGGELVVLTRDIVTVYSAGALPQDGWDFRPSWVWDRELTCGQDYVSRVTLTDFDADGFKEAALTMARRFVDNNCSSGNVYTTELYVPRASFGFGPTQFRRYRSESIGATWPGPLVRDFDADGAPDVFVGEDLTTAAVHWGSTTLGVPDATFERRELYPFYPGELGISGGVTCVYPGDFNGDGIVDLYLGGSPVEFEPSFAILLGRGEPGVAHAGFSAPITFSGYACATAVVDINRDGLDDLVLSNTYDNSEIWLAQTNNEGAWTQTFLADTSLGLHFSHAVTADVDHNGFVDVVTSGSSGIRPLLSNGTTLVAGPTSAAGVIDGALAVGDLNADGITDVAAFEASVLRVLLGGRNSAGPTATFALTATPYAINNNNVEGIQIVDINEDGANDVVLFAIDLPITVVLPAGPLVLVGKTVHGRSTGELMAPVELGPLGTERAGFGLLDVDGDTLADIVTLETRSKELVSFGARRWSTWKFWSHDIGVTPTSSPYFLAQVTLPLDAFGAPVRASLMMRSCALTGEPDLTRLYQEPGLALDATDVVVPITASQCIFGDQRLAHVRHASADVRRTVRAGFAEVGAVAPPLVVFELPVLREFNDVDLATARVLRRRTTWRRASDFSTDPAFGATDANALLAQVASKDRFITTDTYDTLPRAANDDLDAGTGERFAMVQDAAGRVVVRIAAHTLGAFLVVVTSEP